MQNVEERLKEAENAMAEMFHVTCDNLCIYNELNQGKDLCPFKGTDDKCPVGSIIDEYLKGE